MKNVHVRPSPDPREKKACARTRQDRIYERIYYKVKGTVRAGLREKEVSS